MLLFSKISVSRLMSSLTVYNNPFSELITYKQNYSFRKSVKADELNVLNYAPFIIFFSLSFPKSIIKRFHTCSKSFFVYNMTSILFLIQLLLCFSLCIYFKSFLDLVKNNDIFSVRLLKVQHNSLSHLFF